MNGVFIQRHKERVGLENKNKVQRGKCPEDSSVGQEKQQPESAGLDSTNTTRVNSAKSLNL